MSEKRRDNKNRILHQGESQRKDGRYVYKYTDAFGKSQFIYAWKLVPTDKTPAGKRDDISLREKEKQIQKDLDDGIDNTGKNITVSELYELYIRYHSNVKRTTAYWRILFKERLQKDKLSTYLIERVKPSDAQEWVLRMKDSGLSYGTIDNAKRALKAAFTMAVQNDYLRKNPFDLMLGVPPPSRSPTIAVLLFPHKLYRL